MYFQTSEASKLGSRKDQNAFFSSEISSADKIREVQNTKGHQNRMKTVRGVVIVKCLTVMKQSNAAGSEYLNRKRPKYNFWLPIFFRPIKNLRVIRNIKWHHEWMKTVGGVVIAKSRTDRIEIEGEIDELLSAKWSIWNTLCIYWCILVYSVQ